MFAEQHKPSPAPEQNMSKSKLPPSVRKQFAAWGRKGGLKGKREDKVKAGKLSAKVRKAKATNSNESKS